MEEDNPKTRSEEIYSADNEQKGDENNTQFDGKTLLSKWLNKQMRIEMTDGRILIGEFVCTDRNANIILSGSAETYNVEKTGITDEPRTLGLVMIPGRHVVSIHYDELYDRSGRVFCSSWIK